MGRIEPGGPRSDAAQRLNEHRPAYEDVHELTGLRTKLDAHSASAQRPTLPGLFRESFARHTPAAGLPEPAVPVALGRRPGTVELRQMTRRLLDRHGRDHERDVSRGRAESELLATLEEMLRAQERLQSRIARLRRADEDPVSQWTETERYVAREAGHLLLSEGKFAEARAVFAGLVSLDPADGYSYQGLGLAWRGLGDMEKAADAFDAALKRDPKSWRAALQLTEVRLRGARKEAVEAAARAESLTRAADCPEWARSRASYLLSLAVGRP
ncbi:MAG: tetratricopeptide repeat protein [Candidatus Eisenbacteria bacterium]